MSPTEPSSCQPAASREASAAMRAAAVLAALVVLGALAYSFRFQSFMHAKELVWALGAPVAALTGWNAVRNYRGFHAFLPLWIALGVSLVFHTLILPAQMPERVMEASFRYALMLGVAALFVNIAREARANHVLGSAFIASAVVAGILALLQYAGAIPWLFPEFPNYDQRAYSVFGNQDLLGGYMAFGIIATLIRASDPAPRRIWVLLSVPILAAALLVSGSRSAWLAAAAGTIVLLLRRDCLRHAAKTILIVALPAVIVTCILVPEATVARFANLFAADDHGAWLRLWIWDGTLRMIADHPLMGIGPGNYAFWSPSYLGEAFRAYDTFTHAHNEVHTLHAHNEWLELAAETGALGIAFIVWQAVRLRHYRGANWALLAAAVVFTQFNTISHSLPHLLWVLYAAAQMLPASQGHVKNNARPAVMLSGILFFTGALTIVTIYIPSWLLRTAERAEPMDPMRYVAALEYPWPNADARFAYGMALLSAGCNEDARNQLERALRGNDTGAVHLALALLDRARGDASKTAYHAHQAVLRWPWDSRAAELYASQVIRETIPPRTGD